MRAALFLATCVIIFFYGAEASCSEDFRDSAAWWIKNYGAVSSRDEPLVGRAEHVFSRVSSAADKNGKRFPRLLVINAPDILYAASIRDGTIILSLGGLRLCYRSVETGKGDSRLAFLLGHELSHSARDDYWHSSAFAAVRAHSNGKTDESRRLLESLGKATGRGSHEADRLKELQADSYGLLYMAMAGYNPHDVTGKDGTGFFHEWTGRLGGGSSFSGPGYPDASERAEFYRSQLAATAGELDLFFFGVRLYQAGNYEDSLLLLDRFRERFPGREVFSNIGLAWYQLAMRELSSCDPAATRRFMLPAILDDNTLASGFRTKGLCLDNENFRRLIVNAITHLEMAVSKDPLYLSSALNLTSALIMAGEYTKALATADSALKTAPDNPQAISAKSVALYLFGSNSSLDTADTALSMLNRVASQHKGLPELYYNQATIALERGRDATAKDAFRSFLAVEPTGPYASEARKRAGLNLLPAQPDTAEKRTRFRSPVKLGLISGETALRLKLASRRSFRIGRTSVDIYELKGIKALAVNSSIELVEALPDPGYSRKLLQKEYGPPLRLVQTTSGEVLVYGNGAAEVRDGVVSSFLFFESAGR